ncbi:MAG: 3-deoxy-D-manno-octulosonic acid transferase [Myxococcota bacterium]|nr:3-deoxy-D-manno-octulosonic acid transferase [Myxococcota bacterium]
MSLLRPVIPLALPLLRPFLENSPRLRGPVEHRRGELPVFAPDPDSPVIWFHAASAGDVRAIAPTIQAMRERHPNLRALLTVMTSSGYEMALRHSSLAVPAMAPWDAPAPVRLAMARVRPALLVLEYLELWPELMHAAARCGARLALTDGRVSGRNVERYRWLFRVTGGPLKHLNLALMRTPGDAERLIAMGMDPARVRVTGSTKADVLDEPPGGTGIISARELAGPRAVILVAGSIHADEESLVLPVLARLLKRHPALVVFIAPRYLERTETIKNYFRSAGFPVGLLSRPDKGPRVQVADVWGRLLGLYATADLAVAGGGFGSRGGQNILEAARAGVPVLFGPHMRNFEAEAAKLRGRGGLEVRGAAGLEEQAERLIRDSALRSELGARARAAVEELRGVSAANARLLAGLAGVEK